MEDIRKKLRKEFEELLEEDSEESDIPVSERKVKEKKIRKFDVDD